MPGITRFSPPTFATLLALCLAPFASAGTENADEIDALRQRLAELEAGQSQYEDTIESLRDEVDELRAQSGDNWLTEQRAEAIRGLVQDVLADADTRSSMQDGATAGYGPGGFFIASADGNFRLNISATIQVKFAYNHQRNAPASSDFDNDRWGFENRRTALRFGGHIIDPSWKYFIQGAFAFVTGDFILLDATMAKDFGDGWTLKAGKAKLPFSQEQLMSFNTMGLVERSLIANAFGVGRAQGVYAEYKTDNLKLTGAFSDGLGSIVGASAPALAYDTEYALTGRMDFLVSGKWSDFRDFTAWSDNEGGLLVGIGVHWQDGEYGTTPGAAPFNEMHVIRWTADATWKMHPFNVFASVFGNHVSSRGESPSLDQYGAAIQAGWLCVDDKWEVYGRYEWADTDGVGSDLSIATVGAVRYFARQKVKWTTDFGYGFTAVSPQFTSIGKSWRADAPGQEGQYVLRSQVQLVF